MAFGTTRAGLGETIVMSVPQDIFHKSGLSGYDNIVVVSPA